MTMMTQTVPTGAGRIYAPVYRGAVLRRDTANTVRRGLSLVALSYVLMILVAVVVLPVWGKFAAATVLVAGCLRVALRCATLKACIGLD